VFRIHFRAIIYVRKLLQQFLVVKHCFINYQNAPFLDSLAVENSRAKQKPMFVAVFFIMQWTLLCVVWMLISFLILSLICSL